MNNNFETNPEEITSNPEITLETKIQELEKKLGFMETDEAFLSLIQDLKNGKFQINNLKTAQKSEVAKFNKVLTDGPKTTPAIEVDITGLLGNYLKKTVTPAVLWAYFQNSEFGINEVRKIKSSYPIQFSSIGDGSSYRFTKAKNAIINQVKAEVTVVKTIEIPIQTEVETKILEVKTEIEIPVTESEESIFEGLTTV